MLNGRMCPGHDAIETSWTDRCGRTTLPGSYVPADSLWCYPATIVRDMPGLRKRWGRFKSKTYRATRAGHLTKRPNNRPEGTSRTLSEIQRTSWDESSNKMGIRDGRQCHQSRRDPMGECMLGLRRHSQWTLRTRLPDKLKNSRAESGTAVRCLSCVTHPWSERRRSVPIRLFSRCRISPANDASNRRGVRTR